MKVTYTEFAEIVREYYDLKLKNDAYLEKLPLDIQIFIYDNEYRVNTKTQSDMVLKQLFGSDLFNTFMWFLYDAPLDNKESNASSADGRDYYIVDMDSFLYYVKIEYFGAKK